MRTCDLYVCNVERFEEDKLSDIAKRVREHCRDNDVRVFFCRVILNKYTTDTANCKISVPIEQADNVLGIRIWPDGVFCRRWNKDPPYRSRDQGAAGRDNGSTEKGEHKTRDTDRSRSRTREPRGSDRTQDRSTSRVRYSDVDLYYDYFDDQEEKYLQPQRYGQRY